MKTRILNLAIVVLLLLGGAKVLAGKPVYFLEFYGKNGIVYLPVKVEEATDSIPPEILDAMQAQPNEIKTDLVHSQIDLAPLTKPEPEVADEIPDQVHLCEKVRYIKLVRK